MNFGIDMLNSLPPAWPEDPLPAIRDANRRSGSAIVVLDDDPTGTQTVHDIPVLTRWNLETLAEELRRGGPLFYVLTNSRGLDAAAAEQLATEIGGNLKRASEQTGRGVTVISRGDSTLRGHYPAEVDALLRALDKPDAVHVIVPFFEEGGRFTVDDVHYVAEGERLVPVAETSFARDASFGFTRSNLREWVAEKTGGRVTAETVRSVSLNDLRTGGPARVAERLAEVPAGGVCVVNATAMRDVEVLAAALIEVEQCRDGFLCRTAASYVRARAGLEKQPLLDGGTLSRGAPESSSNGGLIVVGSHVPKTTAQLDVLLALNDGRLQPVELSVAELLDERRAVAVDRAAEAVGAALADGNTAVVFTSRERVTGDNAAASLEIGARISAALVDVVRRLDQTPAFLIAKGGITSSDIATRGLGVRRAVVSGQLLPGVPVWRLEAGSRFPGLNYVVFPGNVGENDGLATAYGKLTKP